MQHKQRGFTLIELIMVIVILGILSAFALPKFADLSGNAEQASVDGARASIRSAAAIAHAQALASNTTSGNITIEGTTVNLVNGYPDAETIDDAAGLTDFLLVVNAAGTQVIVTLSPATAANPCVSYGEAASNGAPTISAVGSLGAGADTTAGTADDTCS
ncbi:MAG: type II secretion system protein [Oceanospirillaceae bacterium]|nr:type II secretion system protein [Oceanospirillaceae bacterium]MCP5335887.1 type II secretion system protein [Oceanospirillaceae bacterium]MCP5350361.1 type II secretion system protein [Oceanospirillaceae bacterium]